MLSLGGGVAWVTPFLNSDFQRFLDCWTFFNDKTTPQKSNIKNDGLEHVPPWKHGYFGYLC